MSSHQKDDAFLAHVQELLLDIGQLPDDDESTSYDQDHATNDFKIDPYNADHIEFMRKEIMNTNDSTANTNTEKNHTNLSTNTNTNNDTYTHQEPDSIDTITIKPNEYPNIYEFNGYLSSMILQMLEYAKQNNELYLVNGTDITKFRVTSYDIMMRHIPPYRHFAFLPSATSCDAIPTDECSGKYDKSKIFRSILMKNENVEIVPTLHTLNINHSVNMESLKLIHDLLQLTKNSLLNISLTLRLINNNNLYQREEVHQYLPNTSLSEYEPLPGTTNAHLQICTEHYESNMVISCISSILKLCERMQRLQRFEFALVDFNRECYDYFTHFDTDSDSQIFTKLEHLTIHIDDDLSQSEVSSFPFYAFAASPILAFLKKLPALRSICIIIDEQDTKKQPQNTQQQFTIYFIKKLCEKIFDILNKTHGDLQGFYFKNTRSDCGTSEFFKDMLIHFIKHHTELVHLHIVLHDLCDEDLAHVIQSIYYTESKMNHRSCVQRLESLRLCSKICLDCAVKDMRSLRHHYGDISLSALLHLMYISQSLQTLSLLCFYGADSIKFNALMSAIKSKKHCIRHVEIAQLRKDNDTLYSIAKLFRSNHHQMRNRSKLNWNFYQSIVMSFGVEFDDFYHGDKLQISDMKSFVDLVLDRQLLLQESKLYLLKVLLKSGAKLCMPSDVLWIVVEFAAGLDCLNIAILEWNLMENEELYLLFETVRYFNRKYEELTNKYNAGGIKHIHRKIQWFQRDWNTKSLTLDVQ
eukprot:173000_1